MLLEGPSGVEIDAIGERGDIVSIHLDLLPGGVRFIECSSSWRYSVRWRIAIDWIAAYSFDCFI